MQCQMMKKIRKMSLKMKVTNRKVKIMVRSRKNPSKRLQHSRNARRAEEIKREELVKVRKEMMVHQVVEEVAIVEEKVEARKVEKEKSGSGK